MWKLKKALYGLKQARRAWHECLVHALVKGGFVVSKSDAGLFMKRTATCVVYLITYVDDMLIACAELSEVVAIKQYLGEVFEVTDLGEATLSGKCCGEKCRISQSVKPCQGDRTAC